MPKNVVCKKCNNLVNDWCEKVIDSPDQDMQRDCQYFCEKTNADRIRAMSDEELVVFLDGFSGRCLDCAEDAKNKSCQIYKEGHYCRPQDIMEWLQQPAEGDDHAYLKPCLFCGGEAKLFHPCDGVHLVQCTCCGCGTTYTRTEIGSVRMWNRRVGEVRHVD